MAKKAAKKSIPHKNEVLGLRAENANLKKELEELMLATLHQATRISSLEETNAGMEDKLEEQYRQITEYQKDKAAAMEAGGTVVTELRNAMATIGDLSAAVLNLSEKG